MFEEVSKYPVGKARLFLKYLIIAAAKEKLDHQPLPRIVKKLDPERQREIDDRLLAMSDERKEELESRIRMYYSRDTYAALQQRLERLEARIEKMKANKKHSPAKLAKLKEKLHACQHLLNDLQKGRY